MTGPVRVGSVTAMLAARLAALPTTRSAHGRAPPRPSERESASSVIDAATTVPSTENGVSAATTRLTVQRHQHVQVGDRPPEQSGSY